MAKDWMDPAELQRDSAVFVNLMHALLGLYCWEFATSLDFEWAFITGRKRFRWPIIFYFLNRYCLLAAMVGIAVSFNVQTEVNCQALYTFNQIVGNAVIGFASINLSLRTMAVWEQKWYIVAPLVALMMGQWSFLLHGVLLKAVWMPPQGCVIVSTANKTLAISFVYTMCYDAFVLFLTAFKLATTGGIGRGQRSRLVDMIFSDGLIYFVIAFVANTIATTFMLLNLNPVMSIIFNVPSAIASTIVATRAVRRLSNFLSAEPERFGAPKSSLAFRRGAQTPGAYATGASYAFNTQGGQTGDATATAVTVPMDTFSQAASRPDHEFNDDKVEENDFTRSSTDVEAQYGSKAVTPRAF